MMHDVSNTWRARNDATVGASGFAGVPFQKFATPYDFEASLSEWRTVFGCYGGGDFLLPFTHNRRGFEQDIGSFGGRYLTTLAM